MAYIWMFICGCLVGYGLSMLHKASKGADTTVLEDKIVKEIARKHCSCKED